MLANQALLSDKIIGTSSKWRVLLYCCLSPCFCGAALGYGYGNIGGILHSHYFKEYYNQPSNMLIQILAAAMQAGCILGSLIAGYTADRFGRKFSIIFAASLLTIGNACLFLTFFSSIVPIFAGRLLIGIAGGISCTTVPLYVSEITNAKYRGAVESTFQVSIEASILIAYILNWAIIPTYSNGWRISLVAGFIPAIMFFFLGIVLDESPRWLIMFRGNQEKAIKVLRNLRTFEDDVTKELNGIITEYKQQSTEVSWNEVFNDENRRNSLVALMVLALQVGTGIDIITVYAPEIFSNVLNSDSERDNFFFTIFVGVTATTVTPIAGAIVDSLGRRTLLLVGTAGMTISLSCLAASYWVYENGNTEYGGIMAIVCVLLYTAFFSFSWGPVAWIIPSELVKSKIRAKVVALGTVCNWIAGYLVVSTFLSLTDGIGNVGSFGFYVVVNALAFLFVMFFVPETKGIQLEDIPTMEKDTEKCAKNKNLDDIRISQKHFVVTQL